jgi:hypothetical protein
LYLVSRILSCQPSSLSSSNNGQPEEPEVFFFGFRSYETDHEDSTLSDDASPQSNQGIDLENERNGGAEPTGINEMLGRLNKAVIEGITPQMVSTDKKETPHALDDHG